MGQVVGMGRGALVHQPVVIAPTDIFPTAPCLSRIIAHDYGEDQRDRLSLIWLASVAEVVHAASRSADVQPPARAEPQRFAFSIIRLR